MLAIIIGCYYALADSFVICWLSKDYLIDHTVFVTICINLYMVIVLRPIMTFREAAGLYEKTKYFMLAATIINLVLSIVLGKQFGMAGIFIASALARLSTYFWYEPKLLYSKFFDSDGIEFYKKLFLNCIIVLITSYGLEVVVSLIPLLGFIGWFIKAIVCGCISLVIVLLCYRNTTGFIWLKQKVLSIIGKG